MTTLVPCADCNLVTSNTASSNDTEPSTLDRLLFIPTPDRSAKRAKLAIATSPETIYSKVEQQAFARIEDFVLHFDAACDKLIEETRPSTEGTQWKYVPDDLEQDEMIANVQAARKLLHSLVMRDAAMMPFETTSMGTIKHEEELKPGPKLVLTLYGNAQGHKQLFSSFQQTATDPKDVKPAMRLRENGLPNGIMSTMVVPIKPKDAAANLKQNTFKDVFGPSSSLPLLVPPQATKQTVDKSSSTIVWGATKQQRPERPMGYAHQKLTAGQWLGYGGLAPASSTAVSGGLGKTSTVDAIAPSILGSNEEEQAVAEEDALFRSVYSSFAPSCDNTGAVYSEHIKNEMWWQRVGKQTLEESLGFLPHAVMSGVDSMPVNGEEDQIKQFSQDAELFDPALEDMKLDPVPKTPSTGDEAILEEISELLESLHSYQRIRSMSRKPQSSNLQPFSNQSTLENASAPSELEIETYNTLKAQLALVIATLPPYAVSRLNGDQLEDLNISLTMPIEDKNIRGVMEEDAQSRAAKAAALSAAIGIAATSNRAAGLATPGVGARTAPMGGNRTTQSYNTSTGPNLLRQTSQVGSRQPLSGWQTPTQQNLSATAPRPSYQNQASYGSQSAKPAYNNNNNYRNSTVGQFQSTTNRLANTPLAGKTNYSGIGSAGYQPKATSTNFNYQGAQPAPMTTFASPQPTGQTGQHQQRPSYLSQPIQVGTSTVGGQGAGGSRPQTPGVATALRSVSGTPQPSQAQT